MANESAYAPSRPLAIGVTAISILALFCCIWRYVNPPAAPKGSGPNGTKTIHRFDRVLFCNGSMQPLSGVHVQVFKDTGGGTYAPWLGQDYTFDVGPNQVHANVMNEVANTTEPIRKIVCSIPPLGNEGPWECTLLVQDPAEFRNATFVFGRWNQGQDPPQWQLRLAGDGVVNDPGTYDGLVTVHDVSSP